MDRYVLVIDPLGPVSWVVRDIVNLGYKVLVAHPAYEYTNDVQKSRYESHIVSAKTQFYGLAENIDVPDNADQIVSRLAGYDIVAVFNGSNRAMHLTDNVAKKLGLPGNNPETTLNRSDYKHIYETLRKNGLRTIKTGKVEKEEDIIEFWKNNNIETAVLNPMLRSGDRRTYVCSSVEDTVGLYNRLVEENGKTKDPAIGFVIQEYINGVECVVDVMNYGGTHKILDLWTYNVTNIEGKGVALDFCSTQPILFPGARECMKYAMDVLDATDYNYDLASVEIILDSNGPVLLDLNRKCLGYKITPEVIHKALGHHNTDILAMAYLDTENFNKWSPKDDVKLVVMKSLMCNVSGKRRVNPLTIFLGFLPSVKEFFMEYPTVGFAEVKKTLDFETPAGMALLYNENPETLVKDLDTIRFIESNAPDLLFDTTEKHASCGYVSNISDIEDEIKGKTVAILTDTGMLEYQNGMYTNADMDKKYAGGIILLGNEYVMEKRLRNISNLYDTIKEGGTIWVLQSSYANMPYGAKGIEAVLVILGAKIDYPKGPRDYIIRARVRHFEK